MCKSPLDEMLLMALAFNGENAPPDVNNAVIIYDDGEGAMGMYTYCSNEVLYKHLMNTIIHMHGARFSHVPAEEYVQTITESLKLNLLKKDGFITASGLKS